MVGSRTCFNHMTERNMKISQGIHKARALRRHISDNIRGVKHKSTHANTNNKGYRVSNEQTATT
jgi:hypothetical protein